MHKRIENTASERRCHRCKTVKPATADHFLRDRSRPLGLAYECRSCHSERKHGRDRRKERWGNLTDEQRAKRIERMRRWAATPKGRALFLVKAYQRIDKAKGHECNVTTAYLLDHIFTRFCVYCGTTEQLGCDRVDNSKGHTVDNVVPACADCNIMRGDRFSHQEMLVIGQAVSAVRHARLKAGNDLEESRSEDHPETTC